MVNRKAPQPSQEKPGEEALVIERSRDPLQFLANILQAAGNLAAQWGEEIFLHLRVAAMWVRIGKKGKAVEYLTHLASLHSTDTFNLGEHGIRYRYDLIRFFLTQIGVDEVALLKLEEITGRNKRSANPLSNWMQKNKALSRFLHVDDQAASMLTPEEEQEVKDIIYPPTKWLERVYLTQVPGDCRQNLVQELSAISEYGDQKEVAQRLHQLFDHCRFWHERQSDTPIWVHDLDDIGPRAIYLAVMINRPDILIAFLERCIDALNERPLALMPNIAVAIAGLAYVARQERRDDLLHRGLEFLPRLPEHEQCIAALSLVEVLVERG